MDILKDQTATAWFQANPGNFVSQQRQWMAMVFPPKIEQDEGALALEDPEKVVERRKEHKRANPQAAEQELQRNAWRGGLADLDITRRRDRG